MSARKALTPLLAAFLAGCVAPQPPAPGPNAAGVAEARSYASPSAEWAAACGDWDDWDKRGPAFRIHGDTYYVGTCGIAAILVAGAEGHVLFDTGTRDGSVTVLENIRNLGFFQENLRAILTSHEHYDHVGGLYWVAQNTGAQVYTSPAAARVIATGSPAREDPQFGMHVPMRPVPGRLIRRIEPGKPLALAGLAFTPVATPGHTAGALSWQWRSCEAGECLTIVYADSLTPVSSASYRFSDHPAYLKAYRDGLARLAALECDILLTPHPSASGMREKARTGRFTGGESCAGYAARLSAALDARLAEEAGG